MTSKNNFHCKWIPAYAGMTRGYGSFAKLMMT
jgi:hypothetical protein